MEPAPLRTLVAALDDALAAYDRLAELAEDVEDEWTYVTELTAAWRAVLERARDEAAEAASADPAGDAARVAALDRLAEEVGLIGDPHRAIDWLSTFPQVALRAVGRST